MDVAMKYCDRCGNAIRGNTRDPIHVTSIGTHCSGCLQVAWSEHEHKKTTKKTKDGRGDAARARWANMSPEAKAAHVAKMQAGRATKGPF